MTNPEGPERAPELPARHVKDRPAVDRLLWRLFTITVVASLAAVLVGIYALHKSDELTKSQQQGKTLYGQVVQGGGSPSVTPAGAPPASEISGAPGRNGRDATPDEVQAGVRIVCAESPSLCQQPVSVPLLVSAVRSCFTSGNCPAPQRGAQGSPGASGASGVSGAAGTGAAGPTGATGASGAAAPPVTDTQIVSDLATYCAQRADDCAGPAGPAGATGAAGPSGASAPSVTSIDCTGTLLTDGLTFTFNESDGTSLTVTCSADAPSPTPTSAPPS